MTIEGYATAEGTARYRDRQTRGGAAVPEHFRNEQGLWLSSVGAGTYLGRWDEETDRGYADAIFRAVELGANVIDTAANYRFQRSERSIGAALKRLIEGGGAARDELVVCTKGGYLPFDSEPPKGQAGVEAYVEETFVRTGVVEPTDIVAGSHCMTPRYLAHQIDQSLANMGVATVDVYYVHNPETQLGVVARGEFERRLRAAFEQLERSVGEGKIKSYGVATWTGFRSAPDKRGSHSLERMAELAREAGGGDHHFRFVQLPFNLAMPEALTLDNQTYQGARVSLLEAARALGVTVVASASLSQGKVARGLPAHVREPLGSLATDALTAIQFVRSTPGVATALVGMSRSSHVEENLQLARVAPAAPDEYARLFGGEG
ncbi:MAG TPA: aldo/keto reductase [Pyrinomonadaceae bacterium]|jgi:aryl-alcohol dehydrogenase-like predicted oxidoreductase|nr:aldo/keto reductase [Pyrinomonadaceae bacterium]